MTGELEKIRSIAQPVAESFGVELWDLEFTGGHGSRVLRIYIDKPGGVTVQDCADVSRQVGFALDAEDFIQERYVLEVSSPGLTRQLKKPLDFQRSLGKLAVFKLRKPVDGENRILAVIDLADDTSVTVTVKEGGQTVRLDYADIARANLELEF
ncbi:MAG: ribosome maturation factor RimP [Nitrospinae bacterium]|nr:ribosome maturation factor RimP [Nitrospinota bacterium]